MVEACRSQLGFRFRRQEPLGPFIVDFVCHERRLVIEVDGGQHLDGSYDRARDAWLAQRGYRVLRLWNGDVLSNLEGITEQVYLELYGPSP